MYSNKNESQVSLELAVSLVGVFLLIYAAFNLLIWVNSSLIRRNAEYEKTSKQASESKTPVIVNESDESKFPKLHILGE